MNISKSRKAQSAMEYLMTYGWAILIIAVVLGALFSLGVFNATNFAPRAPAGSCKLFRSTAITALEGECSNIIPQSVAEFNGQNSRVSTAATGFPVGNSPRSVFAWIYWTGTQGSGNFYPITSYGIASAGGEVSILYVYSATNPAVLYFSSFGSLGSNNFQSSFPITQNTWTFVGYTISGSGTTITIYDNGQSQTGTITSPANTVLPATDPADIGIVSSGNPSGRQFLGSISNVQVYNTTLDPAQVQGLYMEGIGGDPIDIGNLVGWWPLNGNTNDYSSSQNTGTGNGIIFTSSWTNGYNPP
jgi:hypothetical protein